MPGCQVYVDAPPAVNVAVLPIQIAVGLDAAVTVGLSTVKLKVAVFEQPLLLTPVTVYMVVEVGVTVTKDPVCAPGFQVYEFEPLAVNEAVEPKQINVELADAVIVGLPQTKVIQ